MWKTVKLSNVCDFQNGFAFKSSSFKESGIPVIRISNIQDNRIDIRSVVFIDPDDYDQDLNRFMIMPNDLLIAMSGATTGKIGFNNTDSFFYQNQRVGNFKPKASLDINFLFYVLTTKIQENLRISKGSAQPNLSTEQINNIKFPLPPLAEQQKIVEKLDRAFEEIDRAIEATKLKQEEVKALKSTVLSQELSGSSDSKMVKLGHVCDFEGGSQPPKSEFIFEPIDGYIRFIQIRDFKSDKNVTYIPVAKKNRTCVEGDILIGRYGASVGQILTGLAGAYNVALMKSFPDKNKVINQFLFLYLLSDHFQKPLLSVSKRSAQNGFSKDEISDFDLPLPPLREQQRIAEKLESAFASADEAAKAFDYQLSSYKSLKSAILAQELKGPES